MRRRQYGQYIAILIVEHDGFGDTVAETPQASAVRIDDFVGSCATTSYTTFLVSNIFGMSGQWPYSTLLCEGKSRTP